MSYYHIKIAFKEQNKESNKPIHIFDKLNLEEIKDDLIIPYLKDEDLFIDGTKIQSKDVFKLKIYSSEQPISICNDIAYRRVPESVFMIISEEDTLKYKDLVKDITDDITNPIRKSLQQSTSNNKTEAPNKKKRKLFISHAFNDKESVEKIISLFEFLGLGDSNMVCSSIDGYGIPLGEDIFEYLRNLYIDSELFVLYIHSQEYYKSAVCLNEMGAAWVIKTEYCSILLPGFEYKDMRGVVKSGTIAIKLDNEDATTRLNELKEKLVEFFSLPVKNQNAWERHRNNLLKSFSPIEKG